MLQVMVVVFVVTMVIMGVVSKQDQKRKKEVRKQLGLRVSTDSLKDDPERRKLIAKRRWEK